MAFGLIVLGLVAIFLLIPFMARGGGVLSLVTIIGISWHRPALIARSLGVLGLLASVCIAILWLQLAAQLFYGISSIDMHGYPR